MANASENFAEWIGRTEQLADDISPATAQAAAATFDQQMESFSTGCELPPLWHWFYFLPKAPQNQLGSDGHPQRATGSFMPPIPYPRRMFAGARLTWHRPLLIGHPARREAVIRDITLKSGRSGRLAFVMVAYRYLQGEDAQLCLEEEQDIVYREPGPPIPPPQVVELPEPPAGAWTRTVTPDSRLLFRFSALTFNAHRIHYDRPYATTEEGYPGLVVHGPLTALLLLHLVRENSSRRIASFRFRGQAPLFDLAPFRLTAQPADGHVDLQATGPDGKTAMTARAEFA
jgi:3-methylfumaryl-CoA hydratase